MLVLSKKGRSAERYSHFALLPRVLAVPRETLPGARQGAGSACRGSPRDRQPHSQTGATGKSVFMFLSDHGLYCFSRHHGAHLTVFKRAPAVTTSHSGKTQAEVHPPRTCPPRRAAAASARSHRVPSAPEGQRAGSGTAGTALPT